MLQSNDLCNIRTYIESSFFHIVLCCKCIISCASLKNVQKCIVSQYIKSLKTFNVLAYWLLFILLTLGEIFTSIPSGHFLLCSVHPYIINCAIQNISGYIYWQVLLLVGT